MSWQEYVDVSLVGSGNLDKAAIFDSEGKSAWATSPGFTVAPGEIKEVINAFNDTNDVKAVQSNGLHVGGERFVVLRADNRSLYGRKGKEGIVIVRTKKALLITHYGETVVGGTAANTVEQLADYLIEVGY
ncbi:MAG: profilin, required for normal timing of actin polymerization in response to thermal stress [Watsoniomyces obsoletus]|nr:MAG: profilin, required for normal timing of actin polymerization in response to thermal stress [Watsoniomyces obsoletus]